MNGASNGGYCGRKECPMSIGGVCGEGQTLEIIHEFKQLYQDKMKQIEDASDRDCFGGQEAKISLQQDWIRDLTEQNEMLVAAVEELEMEATDRVAMLEEKLRNSANAGSDVMQKFRDFNFSINLDETFQKLVYLQNDVRNLLEFIRRARDEGSWSVEGLQFYDVTKEDLLGGRKYARSPSAEAAADDAQVSNEIHMRDKRIRELETLLNEKIEELNASRKSMLDMRSALTVEVADKHDVIVNLRRDVQQLEEQYRQSTKQTQFKDDIIKEMRKDIKLLKGQAHEDQNNQLQLPNVLLHHPSAELSPTKYLTKDCCTVGEGLKLRSCGNMGKIAEQVLKVENFLFFVLGKEIDRLLKKVHERNKLLVFQADVVAVLTNAAEQFYNQLMELSDSSLKHLSKLKDEIGDFKPAAMRGFEEKLQNDKEQLQKNVTEIKQEIMGQLIAFQQSQ